MQPQHRLKQAFLHLEFCIKLFRFFETGHVEKDAFDCKTAIETPQGTVRFPAGTFQTQEDLVLAAKNVYSSALGVCAIAMDSALADHGVGRAPHDRSPEGQLRAFVYQLRNAFAHDAMTPSWHVVGQHVQPLDLRSFGVPNVVDFGKLNGKPLELEQFGGYAALLSVRDSVLRWVATGSPVPPEA